MQFGQDLMRSDFHQNLDSLLYKPIDEGIVMHRIGHLRHQVPADIIGLCDISVVHTT